MILNCGASASRNTSRPRNSRDLNASRLRFIEAAADPESKVHQTSPSTPSEWLDRYGEFLYSYALLRLRDISAAEDVVQETLMAAWQSHNGFYDISSERIVLVGILRQKIIDHCRIASRARGISCVDDMAHDDYDPFQTTGNWLGHWRANFAPAQWRLDLAGILESKEFWDNAPVSFTIASNGSNGFHLEGD